MAKEYIQCNRCVMDNVSDDSICFDTEKGFCNYCRDVESRIDKEYFPNSKGEAYLLSRIAEIKENCKDDKYDCIVGLSGGIDSSYIIYKGYQFGLRMLAIHFDDGLDNPVAVSNITKLIDKTGVDLINIRPNIFEYSDLLYSLLKASVCNIAIAQDNLIIKSLQDYADINGIKYSLDGANFAHESILERSKWGGVNPCDRKYILSLQKRFGRVEIKELQFTSLFDRYIKRHRHGKVIHITPLNYINYDLNKAIKELNDFCGFEYYGGKHYESILTRFMQCYYLPVKFGIDKRKSHFSSLIMVGELSRDKAIEYLKEPLYTDKQLLKDDKEYLAKYIGISVDELERCINLPPKKEDTYPHSFLNSLAPIARKFRKILS